MRPTNIMFSNLRAEMARENLSIVKIAEIIEMNRETLGKKLSGKSPLYLNEAFLINKKIFPDKTMAYLFEELIPKVAVDELIS